MKKTNKKIIYKNCTLWMTAAIITLGGSFSAFASSTAYGPAMEIEKKELAGQGLVQDQVPTVYNKDVNSLKTAALTDQLIIVIGDPTDPAKSTLAYYKKDQNGVLQQVFNVPAVSGMNGISAAKVEGDKKTPQGVYSFTMAFGTKDNPGSILPYHKVVKGDHFVDDSNSRYYNRLVNEFQVEKDWNSSESLLEQSPHYNYSLVLNYNEAYTPGKGSAIFIHCPKSWNNTGTSGCVSVEEDKMKELLATVDQNTKVIIVPEEQYLGLY